MAGSRAKAVTASLRSATAYTLRPSGETVSAETDARPRPSVQVLGSSRSTSNSTVQPSAPFSCLSRPVAGSRAKAETAPERKAAA